MTGGTERDGRELGTLALAAMFDTASAETVRACIATIRALADGRFERMTWHALGVLLEELELAAADDEVWQALVASRLFREEGGVLFPRGAVPLGELYEEIAPGDDVEVPVAVLASLLSPPADDAGVAAATPLEIASAIRRVQAWGLRLLRYAASEQMPGFPAFWRHVDGESVPFVDDVGSMAASDTLLLWVEGARYGIAPPLPDETARVALARAWGQLLELGVDRPGDWCDGALLLAGFDDDFVGAFLREQPERGSCPTVEGTAERLYALLLLRRHAAGACPELATQSERAIQAAARCLLRWQDEGGGWAIHRYPPGSELSMPVRDVSCRYAAESLLLGLALDAFEPALAAEAGTALRRFAELLVAHARCEDERAWWPGDFVDDGAGGRRRATCLFTLLLGALGDRLGDQRLATLQRGGVAELAAGWEPDAAALLSVEFRAPTWEGAALAMFSWEMPADALIVLALLDAAARGVELDADLVARVHRAVAGMLGSEQDGAWLDVKMQEEGLSNAFASNSLHNLRCLMAVAAWQARALPPTVGAGLL